MAEQPSPRSRELGYEPTDVSVRWILIAAFAGLLFVALAAALLYALQRFYDMIDVAPQGPTSMLEQREPQPPLPRLQAAPEEALAAQVQREAELLNNYGWVDREAGIARIPIEPAMRLLAERGWPEPATGPRPPPDAARNLEPWPDWQAPP